MTSLQNVNQTLNIHNGFYHILTEHEGPVTVVGITVDGLNMLAGTSTGNLGYLDVSTRNYTTVMRSHTGRVLCMSLDPVRRQMATVSEDHTIRLWDLDSLQQVREMTMLIMKSNLLLCCLHCVCGN